MTDTHLGGYVSGEIGDPATYYPELWAWAVRELGVRTVLDLGCGEGHSSRFFAGLGCEVLAVDGVAQPDHPYIYQHDFTTGPWVFPWDTPEVDLVWSCEFVEHIEERYLPNLVPALRSGRVVMMTHAFPGQGGHHHVNCRAPDYWLGLFAGIGFRHRPALTNLAREIASANTDPYNHFCRSGLVLERLP